MEKLVRDKIPEIIRQDGKTPTTHTADEDEYKQRLFLKLREECDEFIESESIAELADILEVLDAIYGVMHTTGSAVEKIKADKREARGGFNNRIILDSIE